MSVHPSSRPFRQGYSAAAHGSMALSRQPRVVSLRVSQSAGPWRMINNCSGFRHHYRHCHGGGRTK
jgi:hypothetical protein